MYIIIFCVAYVAVPGWNRTCTPLHILIVLVHSKRCIARAHTCCINSWKFDTFTRHVWVPPLAEVVCSVASNAVIGQQNNVRFLPRTAILLNPVNVLFWKCFITGRQIGRWKKQLLYTSWHMCVRDKKSYFWEVWMGKFNNLSIYTVYNLEPRRLESWRRHLGFRLVVCVCVDNSNT